MLVVGAISGVLFLTMRKSIDFKNKQSVTIHTSPYRKDHFKKFYGSERNRLGQPIINY